MIMDLAIEEARKTMKNNEGGPFGAAIVKDDKIKGFVLPSDIAPYKLHIIYNESNKLY